MKMPTSLSRLWKCLLHELGRIMRTMGMAGTSCGPQQAVDFAPSSGAAAQEQMGK